MWGGGSADDAEVVKDEREWVVAGVDDKRSEYDMNESRLLAIWVGEGGWDNEAELSETGEETILGNVGGTIGAGCSRVVAVEIVSSSACDAAE